MLSLPLSSPRVGILYGKFNRVGRTVRRTGSVAIALLLSACSGSSDLLSVFDHKEDGKAGGSETASLPPPSAPEALPAPAPVPSPAKAIDPKRLVGLTREQVTALIGPPRGVSDNPPATVWAYRTDGCSLDVMFYMDLGTRTFRALAYEVKSDGLPQLAEPECLGRIRAARNAR